MNILVTGGAGFIGSHLIEKLLKLNHDVICLDNFNDFYDPKIKRNNIENSLQSNSSFILLEGDIRDKGFLESIFSDNNFDIVVHLAAMAGVRPSIINPELYYDVNLTGTLYLLEKCKERGIKKFIFASSSSVYGNNKKIPFAESDFVDNPISPYAASKKSGELICHCYHHLYQMSIVCLRYFTVYGPRQRPDLAIHKFARLMLAGKPIPLYGEMSSRRDYTYIADIIDGTLKAIDYVTENNCFDIFNLGGSKAISLSEMINCLENTLGIKALIEHLPAQEGDVWQTYASIVKSQNILGYKPNTEFSEGIRLFIEWLKKQVEEKILDFIP
ncbi:MAG: GDP-mannose 4,6-dehydratase [Candidatus Cloacimonetes bacterium]|nr:GDP-mannose 4,6-dehydratase [Candidatus Cloacimonadota bacterium]